ELRLRLRITGDGFNGLILHRAVEAASAEEASPAEDRRERRSELVRDRREKFVFRVTDPAQLLGSSFDSLFEILRALPELVLLSIHFCAEPPRRDGAANAGDEILGVDGFANEVVRSAAERTDADLPVFGARHQNDQRARTFGFDSSEKLETVETSHQEI